MEIHTWIQNFFYHYQTLIAGILALLAAKVAAHAAWKNLVSRLEKEERDEERFQKGLASLLLVDVVNAIRVIKNMNKRLEKYPDASIMMDIRSPVLDHYLKDLPRLPGQLAASALTALQSFQQFDKMCKDIVHTSDIEFQQFRVSFGRHAILELEIARKWLIDINRKSIHLTAEQAKRKYLTDAQQLEFNQSCEDSRFYFGITSSAGSSQK